MKRICSTYQVVDKERGWYTSLYILYERYISTMNDFLLVVFVALANAALGVAASHECMPIVHAHLG